MRLKECSQVVKMEEMESNNEEEKQRKENEGKIGSGFLALEKERERK